MFNTKRRVAAALIAVTAGLGGALVTAVPATAAPAFAPVRTANPGVGDLQAKLQLVLNTGASRADRANELEAGEAGLPLVDQVGGVMAAAPSSFKWSVQGPVNVQGDYMTAGLQTSVDGFDPWHFDLSWRLIDGTWKLTREAECTIAGIAMLPCNL
ncbi:hypothetical protein [Nocardia sp. NPDC050406]|uniref:hypothetical protein n=1 Tax=Nocardia sp. NPDC050406 TaxID=3364318 RepID=UPI003790496C